VCATRTELFDGPGLVALVGTVPKGSLATHGDGGTPAPGASFGVVHAVPTDRAVLDAIDRCARTSGAYLLGALTSSRGDHVMATGAGVTRHGVSAALFSPDVAVATGLSQGCAPLGPVRRVTGARDQTISTIDGRPALEVLAADLHAAGARDASGLLVAFPIAGSDTGNYLVRNLVGIDPRAGTVMVAHDTAPGDAIQFRRRDAQAARQDLDRMLAGLKRRAPDPRGALYFSCLARGPNLFGPDSQELRAIADAFSGVPLAGFFGNGEICAGRLYTYTGVLALFL